MEKMDRRDFLIKVAMEATQYGYQIELQKIAEKRGKGTDLTPNKILKLLERRGVKSYTNHKRIFIPRDKLSDECIKDMGFKLTLGIPERGADLIRSYRHEPTKLHAHKYKDGWTVHRDEYSPSLKHFIQEGIPAIYYNLIRNRRNMAKEICERGGMI